MKFVDNIKKDEYINFCNNTKNTHFLQSYEWGQSSKKNRGYKPLYVGVKENDELIACALLLKKETPFNMCYLYSPRGFVLDFNNFKLLEFFTKSLKEYLKKINAIYLKVDPGIKYQTIDKDANKIEGENNYKIFENLIKLGYKHKGFNKLYEGNQPRYTIRISLKDDIENIKKNMSKSFLKTIRKSEDYDLKISTTNNIEVFYELIQNNSKKDDFSAYSLEYYQNVFNEFNKEGHIKIFNVSIGPDAKNKLQKELNELKAITSEKKKVDRENKIRKLENDIEMLKDIKEETIICSLICVYTKYGAWSLYIGNNNIAMKTNAVNRVYFESLIDAYNKKYDFYDLFGTVGDPKTTYKNLAGLHDFKRKFGGEYLEFIGEFDLINKPFWYKALPHLLKIYRKLKRR